LKEQQRFWLERMSKREQVKTNQPDWSIVTCTNAGDNGERFILPDGSIRAASYRAEQNGGAISAAK